MKKDIIFILTSILCLLATKHQTESDVKFISPLEFGLYVDTVKYNIGKVYYPICNTSAYPIIVEFKEFNSRRSNDRQEIPAGKTGIFIGSALQNSERIASQAIVFSAHFVIYKGPKRNEIIDTTLITKFNRTDRIYDESSNKKHIKSSNIFKLSIDTCNTMNYIKFRNESSMRQSFIVNCNQGYTLAIDSPNKIVNDTSCSVSVLPKKSVLMRYFKSNQELHQIRLVLMPESKSKSKRQIIIKN